MKNSGQFKKGLIPWNKGTKGLQIAWNKGKKWSKKTRKKISEANLKNPHRYWLGKKRPNMTGEKNPEWKGDKVSYGALHVWIRRNFGKPNKCENPECVYPRMNDREMMIRPKRFDWANMSGKYLRDRTDWKMLCVSCHKIYDLRRVHIF